MDIYKRLEKKFVKYKDLVKVKVRDNRQKLVKLSDYGIKSHYLTGMDDMKKILGNDVFVREEVAKKLVRAKENLKLDYSDLDLLVTYGFRDLSVQTMRFLKRLKTISDTFFEDAVELYEEVHRSVAVPNVAGHPTGGAVDVVLIGKNGDILDFGSKIYDYGNKDFYVFALNISKKARKNRMLLRNCMLKAGFAPFDGEWWHFSFGDKEWAFYYKKTHAIYRQLDSKEVRLDHV